jgi:hypothetical protein
MAPEHEIATVAVRNERDDDIKTVRSTEQPIDYENKKDSIFPPENANRPNPIGSRLGSLLRAFEQQLVEYNLEARGIERVAPDERMKRLSWVSYLQTFLLWVSINLAANNITLGMLGPAVYGLSFTDSALCAVFGAIAGSLVSAWVATWGPLSGIRTMAFGRYSMGWWPSKIIVLLNLVQMIGYCLIDCVVGGQILSAVSPGGLSVAVGM